ncbi:hypothetical protein Tco_1252933 [Tanacetum coccineum]
MSPAVEETPNADGSVRNTANREEGARREFLSSSVTSLAIHVFCEKHYDQILPFMAEKAHNEKLKDVRSRLRNRSEERRKKERQEQKKKDVRELIRSYVTCSSKRQRENEREYWRPEREYSKDEPLKSEDSVEGRHWKRQSRKAQKRTKDDFFEPYDKEYTTPFTRRINEFVFPKRIWMPMTIKTYNKTGDPKDHLKTFTIATKLWSDELQPESSDTFKDLRKKFLANYLQQKRYTRDPIELYHVKHKEGEST